MSVLQLETCRRKRGVSLESIADHTKISCRFLRAIESEEFEKLPGGVFSTSYIRQYAAAIGFSEERLLGAYNARVQQSEIDMAVLESQMLEHRRSSQARSWRSWFSWLRSPAAERT